MALSELLLEIVPGHPRRRDAMAEVYGILRTLMASVGAHDRIPEQKREDVINDVIEALLLREEPLPVAGKDERSCTAYLRQMLINRWWSLCRRKRTEDHYATKVADERGAPEKPAPEHDFDLELARSLLVKVYRHLLERRRECFRDALERNWGQLQRLAFEGGSMEALLRAENAVTPEERKRAQQRIHQNHSRLRKDLAVAAEAMARQDHLSSEEVQLVLQLIKSLDRSQRTSAPAVSKGEEK
jgi:DNA-directed RNA polymerase specialized sigma24 family protein